jgi:hypothetical protein
MRKPKDTRKRSDLFKELDKKHQYITLQQWAMQTFISGEAPDSYESFEMKLDGSRCSISLYRMDEAHGGFIVEIERNSTWKRPQVHVAYLDDMLVFLSGGYGLSGNHAPRRTAIAKLVAFRDNALTKAG